MEPESRLMTEGESNAYRVGLERGRPQWLGIEYAPKDGGATYVLLRCTNPSPHTCVGTFYCGKWKPIHADFDFDLAPTHFMPLPKPPAI